jgi:hypothetical protein
MFATATIIGLALAGAGAATQAVGQYKAGQAAKKAGEAQRDASESEAQLADYNAQVADLQAADATARGAEDEQKFRTSVRGMIGSQRASQAAGNIDVSGGSAADVQADAAYLGELDALTIRTNAAREAWGYQVQGEDLRKRADIARKEGVYLEKAGQQQATTATIGAVGTLATTGGSLLMSRYGFGRPS